MTDQDRAILAAYAQGTSVDIIAINEAMSTHVVESVLQRFCGMDRAVAKRKVAEANRPPLTVKSNVVGLAPSVAGVRSATAAVSAEAEAHPSQRVRRQAEKARTLLAGIAEAIEADREQAAGRERLRKAEAELAAARAALGLTPKRSTPPALGQAETAKIRAWCADNGIVVGSHGRLPQTAVDAYRKAVAS